MMRETLIKEFHSYSERMKRALISKNYHAVRTLDLDRRLVIQKLCSIALEEKDQEIFSLMENTISDTTDQITSINENIKTLDKLTASKSKMLKGYQVIN